MAPRTCPVCVNRRYAPKAAAKIESTQPRGVRNKRFRNSNIAALAIKYATSLTSPTLAVFDVDQLMAAAGR